VSTRFQAEIRALDSRLLAGRDPRKRTDLVEEMALMAQARRELMLRAHRHRLRKEDLEDCYSQATLELLAQAQRGRGFSTRAHMANVLEQRFVSRIHDRRRALRGRSPAQAALDGALSLGDCEGEVEVADRSVEVDKLVMLRMDPRSAFGSHQQDRFGDGLRPVLPPVRMVQGEVPQGGPACPGAAARAAGE
jgi:hypothetical protein